jgi:cell division septation protein DedD
MAPKPSKKVTAAAADTVPVHVDGSKREQAVTQQAPEKTSAEPTLPTPKGYAIQVGAYRNREYADTQVTELQKRGYVSYIYEVTDAQQRSFFLVRFGQFATREAAAESVAEFMEKEKMTAVIVRAGAM